MDGHDNLGPNWLAEELNEATSDLALSFAPGAQLGPGLSRVMVPPLEPGDAARLRAKMANRYRAWTGRDLAADLAELPSPVAKDQRKR